MNQEELFVFLKNNQAAYPNLSGEFLDEMPPDTDLFISLCVNEEPIAVCGISKGLERYYQRVHQRHSVEPYKTAMLAAENNWVFAHMQTVPRTEHLRRNRDYRSELVHFWDHLAQQFRFRIPYFLPADVNYWRGLTRAPSDEIFVTNYDRVARRTGFTYNSKKKLYERLISIN
jgi:hypothetical protein